MFMPKLQSLLIRQKYMACFFLLLFLSTLTVNVFADQPEPAFKIDLGKINLGQPLSLSEIEKYSITVSPDGKHLPKGQGSVANGRELYNNQCKMCHGESGIEGPAARLAGTNGWISFSDPLRILRIKEYPVLLISVGGMWPYASSIFDYIRRAMPHYAPKSLSNDQVYALTAYLLYLNELVDEKTILDQRSLLKIKMPSHIESVKNKNNDHH